MVPARVWTGKWVAAARAAQRLPRVDSLGQPRSPEPASTRAALYVHVSGQGRVEGGGGGGWRLSRCWFTCTLSVPQHHIWHSICPPHPTHWEKSWATDLKSGALQLGDPLGTCFVILK